MSEILFHTLILATFGVFYRETYNINLARVTDVIGPAGFPRGILLIGMALTLISLFRTLRKGIARNGGKVEELNLQFLGVLGTVVAFIFLSEVIGFLLAGIILLAVVMLLLGNGINYKTAVVPVIAGTAFTVIFGQLLSVPLPRGMGIIRELSFLIY